jgi:hypothetical protein
MQPPTRPFESLDWFREASRREYRSGNAGHQALRWLRSSRCFAFHIGLFALGVTVALAINVARTPGSIWVDRMAMAWILLLVIHAVVVSLIFAVGLLGTNEERLPKYVPRIPAEATSGSRPAAAHAEPVQWPAPPPREEEPSQNAATPPAGTTPPQPGWSQWAEQEPTRPEGGWPTATSGSTRSRSHANETASWREASPAAWLRRKRTQIETPPITPPPAQAKPPPVAHGELTPTDTAPGEAAVTDETTADTASEAPKPADRESNDA